jgi:GNAT superfamily N-acetyltransferase
MTRPEVQALIAWAAAEGWNPGRHDAESFWHTDPEGFLAAEAEGELAGGGAIFRHHPQFGFMGLFIVRPEFRRRRLGARLWYARRDRLIARLDPGATIGLDGVDAMVPFYERGGFRPFARHRRFQLGTLPTDLPPSSPSLVALQSLDRGAIQQFDRRCFAGDRSRFLEAWLGQPEAAALGAVGPQGLRGYGVVRPCVIGWKIGPLFAEGVEEARRLFHGLCRAAGSGPLWLDVPDDNPAALQLCAEHRMTEVFRCTRMYLGPPPDVERAAIFGVATLEAG